MKISAKLMIPFITSIVQFYKVKFCLFLQPSSQQIGTERKDKNTNSTEFGKCPEIIETRKFHNGINKGNKSSLLEC